MQFSDLLAFGYGPDLVCVIPPGAKLHPSSAIRPEDRGKSPGRPGQDGTWGGYDWRTHAPSAGQMQWWQDQGANVGLQTAKWPAVDIDVTDPALAAAIQLEAALTVGAAPCRTRGESPKRLLLYSTTTPMGKSKLVFELDGQRHAVEVLGAGQQFVAGGTHPSGNAYAWDRDPDPIDLVRIGTEDVGALFDGIEDLVAGRGGTVISRTGRGAAGDVVRPAGDLAGDAALLGPIVAQMPNEGGWDELQDMAYACKAAMGEDGLPVLLEWASRWTVAEADETVTEALWARCVPPYRIGANWIMDKAAALGVETASAEFAAAPLPPAAPRPAAPPPRWSDLDVAHTVARRAEADGRPFAWVPELGQFLQWGGTRWEREGQAAAAELTAATCAGMAAEIREAVEGKTGQTQARAMCSGRTIGSAQKLLQGAPGVTKKLNTFDTDDWILNTPSGVVDLRSGAARPHASTDLCLSQTAVAPSKAPRPRWDAFVNEVTGGQADFARYLQKLAGYALTGSTKEQMLAFLYGPGGNGKSVFVGALSGILGSYAKTSGMDVFLSSRSERHKTEVARLAGARLVTAEETEDGRRWDKARVSEFTGGSVISARFIGEDFFEFTPKFKLLFCGNHRPATSAVDDALKRRLHILPFTFKPTAPNHTLAEELREEWGAILQWAIEGCLLWQREGLAMPKAARDETEDYFEQEDSLAAWARERAVIDPDAFASTRELYADWKAWAEGVGEFVGTCKGLSQRLRPYLGKLSGDTVRKARRNNGTLAGFSGVRLRRVDETPEIAEFQGLDNVVSISRK